ncbi:MAG TPA: carboxypeptidase-like regulatory domain-containing protein [Pyrinomonadaceae bacterium]|nr:carboxypeptidase-like regulatory domain-containing protein [Pyrinomonadaceae bacterium]
MRTQTSGTDQKSEITTGSITGRVLNDGKGVAGATVFASAAVRSPQTRNARTDSDGNFVFEGLDRALYSLSAFAPGFVVPPPDPEAAAPFYRIGDSAQLNLIKGGVITGSVLSLSGQPVVLVPVRATLIRDNYGNRNYGNVRFERVTDDRGIYRIYGLPPGTYLVSAGGPSFGGPYEGHSPTYAPSSARDAAAQFVVTSGSEITGVDIKYRGEDGHAISGTITGQIQTDVSFTTSVSLNQLLDGSPAPYSWTYVPPGVKGFAFYGIADGDYELTAQLGSRSGGLISETKRITVRGTDVTGVELNLKAFASVNGRVLLTRTDLAACKDKREPLLTETLVSLRAIEADKANQQPLNLGSHSVVDKSGDFQVRNLRPGQYQFGTRFFAKYWFLKSIVKPSAKTATATTPTDLAKTGLNLKFGDNISGVTVNLAEGAASLRGTVKATAGERLPERLFAYLVPAEKEFADDVLRFFAAQTNPDGSFGFNNVAPGRYFAITQVAAADETQIERRLRLPNESMRRARLRREAEAGKSVIELKPCQNLTEYSLPSIATTRPQ